MTGNNSSLVGGSSDIDDSSAGFPCAHALTSRRSSGGRRGSRPGALLTARHGAFARGRRSIHMAKNHTLTLLMLLAVLAMPVAAFSQTPSKLVLQIHQVLCIDETDSGPILGEH